jgi:hypothetical protein
MQKAGRLAGPKDHPDATGPARLPVFYFSPAIDSWRDYTDVVIEAVGLVAQTTQTGTAPSASWPAA